MRAAARLGRVSSHSRDRHLMKATAVFAAAGLVAAGPQTGPQPGAAPAVGRAVQLVGDSILNIPFNLFQALVNVPANEVAGLGVLADSLLYTGNWFTPSGTNVWGEDPGDPSHFMAVVDLLVPFQAISGLGDPEIDPDALANGTAGLGQQLAMLAAAWLPASDSCDAIACVPMVPVTPVTGIVGIDRILGFFAALQHESGMFAGWFKVPLADLLDGYHFADDLTNPSAGVGPGGAVPGDDVLGFPGTHTGPDGENLLPWAGLDFKFNPLGPFENFYNSLLAEPDPDGFQLVGMEEVGRTLQTLAAGLVIDFNPFVPGSPACPGPCTEYDEMHLGTADIVKAIGAAWPGNPAIDHWLELNAAGLANGPTDDQINAAIAGLQVGIFQFDPATTAQINDALAAINPYLPNYLTNAGILTDPAYAGWDGSEDTIPQQVPPPDGMPVYGPNADFMGGHDPSLLWADGLYMLDPSGGLYSGLEDFWGSLSGLL